MATRYSGPDAARGHHEGALSHRIYWKGRRFRIEPAGPSSGKSLLGNWLGFAR